MKGNKVWLLKEKKCVISKNVVFTNDKVYKDLNVCKVKPNDTEELKNQTVLEDPAGSASGPEVETSCGVVDETAVGEKNSGIRFP